MLALTLFYTLTFLFAIAATRASLAWALHKAIIDQPNHRSSHTRATPRGGGLGIVAACVLALAAATLTGWLEPRVAGALACGLPIALTGYIDDRVSLSARLRLLVQALCALGALTLLSPLPTLELSGWTLPAAVTFGLYFLATIWLTNLFNFMDGIDGIAAGQAIAAGLVWYVLLGPAIALPLIVLAVAAAGFLVYNRPPARIFMGDVGSAFCGFYIMVATLAMGQQAGLSWPLAWFLPVAPFILDATLTLITRILRGQRPGQAHRSHAYQILARRAGRHGPVSAAYTAIAVVWFGAATWLAIHPDATLTLAVLAIALLPPAFALLWLGAGREDR